MHINDFVTHIDNADDLPYLKSVLFDVNMRLYNNPNNVLYRTLVKNCCDYLTFCALHEMDGYSKPYGMSGANIGIPFNIIGIVRLRGTKNEYCEVMINPRIVERSKETETSKSNCGSIRLPESIEVERSKTVVVEFYNTYGQLVKLEYGRHEGGFTIQHEIEHNNGILITDIAKAPF